MRDLQAGLVDELHLAVRPVLLGAGEHLLGGIDPRALGDECAETVAGERATHVFVRRRDGGASTGARGAGEHAKHLSDVRPDDELTRGGG